MSPRRFPHLWPLRSNSLLHMRVMVPTLPAYSACHPEGHFCSGCRHVVSRGVSCVAGGILVTVCCMTHPAVDGPVRHTEEPAGPSEPSQLEEPAQLETPTHPEHPGSGTTPWRTAAVIAAAGVPVGLLWWLL